MSQPLQGLGGIVSQRIGADSTWVVTPTKTLRTWGLVLLVAARAETRGGTRKERLSRLMTFVTTDCCITDPVMAQSGSIPYIYAEQLR